MAAARQKLREKIIREFKWQASFPSMLSIGISDFVEGSGGFEKRQSTATSFARAGHQMICLKRKMLPAVANASPKINTMTTLDDPHPFMCYQGAKPLSSEITKFINAWHQFHYIPGGW